MKQLFSLYIIVECSTTSPFTVSDQNIKNGSNFSSNIDVSPNYQSYFKQSILTVNMTLGEAKNI